MKLLLFATPFPFPAEPGGSHTQQKLEHFWRLQRGSCRGIPKHCDLRNCSGSQCVNGMQRCINLTV